MSDDYFIHQNPSCNSPVKMEKIIREFYKFHISGNEEPEKQKWCKILVYCDGN